MNDDEITVIPRECPFCGGLMHPEDFRPCQRCEMMVCSLCRYEGLCPPCHQDDYDYNTQASREAPE